MTQQEQEAILTVCLMAAFADNDKSEVERAQIKRVLESFPDGELQTVPLYQRVLQQKVTLPEAVGPLQTPGARNLAYEMAVCVCEADDLINEAENRFLQSLRQGLQLNPAAAASIQERAEAVATVPLAGMPPVIAAASAPAGSNPAVDEAELDRSVLHYSILNGALELLPESVSTMAIIPLQMKMVHGIGKQYGYSLDRGHIREFLATLGVGLTSQVVEGYALKLLGGVFGKFGGFAGRGMARKVVNQAASSAIAFATTYALGQAARRYYAGGRKMSALDLKGLFQSFSDKAKTMHAQYAPQIQERASSLNVASLLPMIRGQ